MTIQDMLSESIELMGIMHAENMPMPSAVQWVIAAAALAQAEDAQRQAETLEEIKFILEHLTDDQALRVNVLR